MSKYCDINDPRPISSGIFIKGYCFDPDMSDDDIHTLCETLGEDDPRSFDISVNAISHDDQQPSLIVTGDFPLTIPAARIHYCPMCGRKLD